MIALLLLISARLVDLVRVDEKALAEIEATGLAEHFAQLSTLPDSTELEGPTELIRATRLNIAVVHVWERIDDRFKIKWSTPGNADPSEMPPGIADLLRENRVARIESGQPIETPGSLYRVFAPIIQQKKVVGAVEITHHLCAWPIKKGSIC